MPAQFSLKRIFWVVLVLTLLVWTGVGIYFLTTKEIQVPKKISLKPSVQPKYQSSPTETMFATPTPYLPPGVPADAKMIVGVVAKLEPEELVITANGKDFHIAISKIAYSLLADLNKGVIMGAKLKVYYKEENGKLNFIAAGVLK